MSRGAIRPGLCSIAFRTLGIDEVVTLAADAGLDGIEWGGDVHVPPGDLAAADRARAACADADLDCPSYGSYLVAGRDDDARDAFATTTRLGASTVRVWAGDRGSLDADTDHRARVAEALRAWCRRADDEGVHVGLEHHGGTLTDTAASTIALLDAVDSPALRTYWQPRDGDAGSADLDELAVIGDRLAHVHVFWWRSWLERFPLADGGEFWRPALDAAATQDTWDVTRWAHIEFVRDDDPAQLHADAAALRGWLS